MDTNEECPGNLPNTMSSPPTFWKVNPADLPVLSIALMSDISIDVGH